MHVVQQLDLIAQRQAHVLEQLGDDAHVGARLVDALPRRPGRRRRKIIRPARRRPSRPAPGPVVRHAGNADLNAHMTVALFDEAARHVFDFLEGRARGVRVAVGRHARFAAEQLVDGHVGALALDVPQRLVDAAHGVVKHRPVAPVRADVHRLPDVFDVIGVFTQQERSEEVVHRRDDSLGALVERGAPQPVKPRLARIHLHHHQADARRGHQHGLDAGDLERRQPALRLRLLRARRERQCAVPHQCSKIQRSAPGHGLHPITPLHRLILRRQLGFEHHQACPCHSQPGFRPVSKLYVSLDDRFALRSSVIVPCHASEPRM